MLKYLFIICATLITLHHGFSQDFVFPNEEETAHLSGNNPVITERIPVYIPMRCPENMLLYPGPGDESTWSCDCRPGYLYFPQNSTCYSAYRQGPCPHAHYVRVTASDPIPGCVENPCTFDGLVLYNGVCQALGSTGESCPNGLLRVNSATFQIECVPLSIRSKSEKVTKTTPGPPLASSCPPGTRKLRTGTCITLLR